jgi:hypothetical protein
MVRSSPAKDSAPGASGDSDAKGGARGFWRLPFALPQALVVAIAFFLNGWALSFLSPVRDVALPPWPVNLYVFGVFAAVLVAIAAYFRSSLLVASFASIPMSVASMGTLCGLSMLAGFIPQGGADWLHNVKGSWPFAFVLFLVLTNLGLAAFRRLFSFRRGDVWFLMVHIGIWIVLAAMACGASDLQKLRLQAVEGQATALAFRTVEGSSEQFPMTMPFEVMLNDFSIEQYPPKLIRYDLKSGKGQKLIPEVAEGKSFGNDQLLIEVVTFFPLAERRGDQFVEARPGVRGSVPAAQIRVSRLNPKTLLREGWVAASPRREQMAVLHLDDSVLTLTEPDAKLYRSDVAILERGVQVAEARIEVNRPFEYRGWKIYQTSYDAEAGVHSRISIFELIRDPWLPVVYFGSFLVLLGSLDLLWNGLRRTRDAARAEEVV